MKIRIRDKEVKTCNLIKALKNVKVKKTSDEIEYVWKIKF